MPADSLALGQFVLSLSAFLALWLSLRKVEKEIRGGAEKREVGPQPFEIKAHPEYARREELAYVVARQDRMDAKLDTIVKDLSEAGEDRARRLHARLDQVIIAVSAGSASVAEISGELKRLPCDRCP
jgi:hypothetical protein